VLTSPPGAHEGSVAGNVNARFKAGPFVAGIDGFEIE
jgi:hypothetical protein